MILLLKKDTPEAAIRQLLAQLAVQNVKGGCVAGRGRHSAAAGGGDVAARPHGAGLAALREGGPPPDPGVPSGIPCSPPGHHGGAGGRGAHRRRVLPHCRAVRRGERAADHRCGPGSEAEQRRIAAAGRRVQAPHLARTAFRAWVKRAWSCWCRRAGRRACPR